MHGEKLGKFIDTSNVIHGYLLDKKRVCLAKEGHALSIADATIQQW